MAKIKSNDTKLISFGHKKSGMAKKKFGPKEQKPQRYRGQGKV